MNILIRHYKVDFLTFLDFHDYLLRSTFHGIERFYPAYLLLLNLINTVRFSQTMTVLQLAAINLILISLIVCQTLSYDVDSFFFIILSGHQTLLYVYEKN